MGIALRRGLHGPGAVFQARRDRHTDIGALNQIVHIWPYESRQERADIRATAANVRIDKWPPRSPDLLGTQKADILQPVQNMKEWGSRSSGVISMSCICTPMLPAT